MRVYYTLPWFIFKIMVYTKKDNHRKIEQTQKYKNTS